jgi:hypothetical protein
MKFNFERFEQAGLSFAPKVTIRSNGSLGFSQGALNRFNLREGNWYVVLYYDREQQVIGIKPTQNKAETGAIPLMKKQVSLPGGKTSLNSFVSSKSFMDFYGIDYSKSATYLAEALDAEEMIVVRLGDRIGDPENTSEEEPPDA